MAQTKLSEPTAAAQRMHLYRQRKRQGVVCIARVPVYQLDVEKLVESNRLKDEDSRNGAKIAEAIEALVDDFTEARLVPAKLGDRKDLCAPKMVSHETET